MALQRQTDDNSDLLEDHEYRIRVVEVWKERAIGVITAVGIMVGGGITVIGWLIATGRIS